MAHELPIGTSEGGFAYNNATGEVRPRRTVEWFSACKLRRRRIFVWFCCLKTGSISRHQIVKLKWKQVIVNSFFFSFLLQFHPRNRRHRIVTDRWTTNHKDDGSRLLWARQQPLSDYELLSNINYELCTSCLDSMRSSISVDWRGQDVLLQSASIFNNLPSF